MSRRATVEPAVLPPAVGAGAGFEETTSGPLTPRRPYKPTGASPVAAGKDGLSQEAVQLFDRVQRAGGTLALRRLEFARTNLTERRSLAAELVHFGIVDVENFERRGVEDTVVTIVDEHRHDILIPGGEPGGWSCWMAIR